MLGVQGQGFWLLVFMNLILVRLWILNVISNRFLIDLYLWQGIYLLTQIFVVLILGRHLLLDNELFEYTKPGLSSFSKDPHKVSLNSNGDIKYAL